MLLVPPAPLVEPGTRAVAGMEVKEVVKVGAVAEVVDAAAQLWPVVSAVSSEVSKAAAQAWRRPEPATREAIARVALEEAQ